MKQAQQKPRRSSDYQIAGIPLPTATLKTIDALAKAEQRTRASMCRVLIVEALNGRSAVTSNN